MAYSRRLLPTTTRRVFGYLDGQPVETVWWCRQLAEELLASVGSAEAPAEPDPRRALAVMAELQLDAVRLAPSGPNVDRAQRWLAEALELLR